MFLSLDIVVNVLKFVDTILCNIIDILDQSRASREFRTVALRPPADLDKIANARSIKFEESCMFIDEFVKKYTEDRFYRRDFRDWCQRKIKPALRKGLNPLWSLYDKPRSNTITTRIKGLNTPNRTEDVNYTIYRKMLEQIENCVNLYLPLSGERIGDILVKTLQSLDSEAKKRIKIIPSDDYNFVMVFNTNEEAALEHKLALDTNDDVGHVKPVIKKLVLKGLTFIDNASVLCIGLVQRHHTLARNVREGYTNCMAIVSAERSGLIYHEIDPLMLSKFRECSY